MRAFRIRAESAPFVRRDRHRGAIGLILAVMTMAAVAVYSLGVVAFAIPATADASPAIVVLMSGFVLLVASIRRVRR